MSAANIDNKKTISTCRCTGGNGKEVIVITIETCCRKNCPLLNKSSKESVTDNGDGVTPLPVKQPSKHLSKHSIEQQKSFQERDPSLPVIEESGLRPSQHSSIHERDPSQPALDESDLSSSHHSSVHHRDPSLPALEEDGVSPSRHSSVSKGKSEHKLEPVKEKSAEQVKGYRKYQLPLVIERHHGPGCAMEIAVLEKHENSCMYKKEETPGRGIDDRVGSYECIGRMVFRTCNPNELESDSSAVSQGVVGSLAYNNKPGGTGKPSPTRPTTSAPEATARSASPSHPGKEQPHVHPSSPRPSPTPSVNWTPSKTTPDRHHSLGSEESRPSFYGSARSQPSSSTPIEEKTESDIRRELVEEQPAKQERRESLEASKRPKQTINNNPHVFVARTVTEGSKHYPGDKCKLRPPKDPFSNECQVEQIYPGQKKFRRYTDESNQTDGNSGDELLQKLSSLETISSLTNMVKVNDKKRSSFLGSLFRKNSARTAHGSGSSSRKLRL